VLDTWFTTGAASTFTTLVAVELTPLSVATQVYVVVVVGDTVTLAVVAPPGDHRKVAPWEDEAFSVVDAPAQIVVFVGVTVNGGGEGIRLNVTLVIPLFELP
jgi:hypothetical protein